MNLWEAWIWQDCHRRKLGGASYEKQTCTRVLLFLLL